MQLCTCCRALTEYISYDSVVTAFLYHAPMSIYTAHCLVIRMMLKVYNAVLGKILCFFFFCILLHFALVLDWFWNIRCEMELNNLISEVYIQHKLFVHEAYIWLKNQQVHDNECEESRKKMRVQENI